MLQGKQNNVNCDPYHRQYKKIYIIIFCKIDF